MKRIAWTVAAVLPAAAVPAGGSDLAPVTDLRVVSDYRPDWEPGTQFHCVYLEWTYDVSAQADVLAEMAAESSTEIGVVVFSFEIQEVGTEEWMTGGGSWSSASRVRGTGYPGMSRHRMDRCAATDNRYTRTMGKSYLYRLRVCPGWPSWVDESCLHEDPAGSVGAWDGSRWTWDPAYASEPGNAVQVQYTLPEAPTVDGSDLAPVTDLRVVSDYRPDWEPGTQFHCVYLEWTYDVSAQADVLAEMKGDSPAVLGTVRASRDVLSFHFEIQEVGTEEWVGGGSGSSHATQVRGTGYPGMSRHVSRHCATADNRYYATFGKSYLYRVRVCPYWPSWVTTGCMYEDPPGSGIRSTWDPAYASEPGNAVQVQYSDGSPEAPTLSGQVLHEPGTDPVVHLGWASVRGVVGGEPPTSYRVIAKRKGGKWATAATALPRVDGEIAAAQTWLVGLAPGLWRFRVEALNQYGKRRSNMVSLKVRFEPSAQSSAQLDVTIRRDDLGRQDTPTKVD